MSSLIGMQRGGTRKRSRAHCNPSENPTKAFAFKRFSSAMGLSSPDPTTPLTTPPPRITVPHVEPAHEPFQADSPRWEAEKAPTEGKDPEFQKSSPLDLKPIKTEVPEFQMSSPLYTKPIKTEGTSEYTRESQEIGDQHTYLVPLFRSCKRSISSEDAKEVNKLELLELWQKSVSMNLNAVYCQHAAKSCLDKVYDEMSRLRTEQKMLRESNQKLENDLFTEKTQAREEKARIELEKIKIKQEKKRAEEEKVRADTLVAQIEESRNKLSEELQRTKAALEEEKSKVSKLTEGISTREVAALEAFKQSKEFSNLMFEQFARGYDDCRAVIQEHHCGLDLSWMDVKDDTDE